MLSITRAAALALTISLLAGGCQTSGPQAASDASKAFATLGNSIGEARSSLESIGETLEQMATAETRGVSGDLQGLFVEYRRHEADLAKAAKRLGDATKGCQKAITAYVEMRRAQNASMSDAAVKQLDLDQIDMLVAKSKTARDSYVMVKNAFDPLLDSAASLETYLANNLNAAGVRAGAALFRKTVEQIRDLAPALQSCEQEFQRLADSMVPPQDQAASGN